MPWIVLPFPIFPRPKLLLFLRAQSINAMSLDCAAHASLSERFLTLGFAPLAAYYSLYGLVLQNAIK